MDIRSDWFFTFSGKKMYVLDPDPGDITIEDIAHSLARQCRFYGHIEAEHYSVAQHSVIVSRNCPESAKAALLHDATEAYLGDVIRPVKRQLTRAYALLEASWMAAIEETFELAEGALSLPEIKIADGRALMTERRDLCPAWAASEPWVEDGLGLQPFDKKILPLKAREAERLFLARWGEVR